MPRRLLVIITVAVFAGGALAARLPAQAPAQSPASAALPTPVGTPTENGLAGFAKILCSAVFISGREPAEAARNSAYFFMPRAEQDKVTFSIDREARTAQASFNGITREARQYGDQGCIIQNPSSPGIHFKPVPVRTALPDAASQAWPMGDRADTSPWPAAVDKTKIDAALDAAFADPAALTAAFLVLHKGRIVGERYAAGITKDTQLESWSMGKSITATLFALARRGRHLHARAARAGAALAATERSARPDPQHRSAPHERGSEVRRQSGTGRIAGQHRARSLLHLHGRHRRVQFLDYASARGAAKHAGPVPQLRSADDRLS